MFLSDTSIKRPIMVSMILLVFVLFGGLSYSGMNLELTPPIEMPVVTVQTVYGGVGPEELETQVTKKIEDAVVSIAGIDYVQSYSMENVSLVMIVFNLDKDVYLGLQEVKDKVDGMVGDLPADADPPVITRFDPLNLPVVSMVLSGAIPITDLYDLADNHLAPRLAQIRGVADVRITGGREREIRVAFDNRVVLQNEIPLRQVAQLLAAQNLDMPGGNFQRQGREYSVRLEGEFEDVEAIRNLEIPTAYGVKRLGEIADVTDTGKEVRERTTYFDNVHKFGDDNVIQLALMKTSDGNPVDIYRTVGGSLEEIGKALPEGCRLHLVSESATFVEATVTDTVTNILLGIILTSLVLLFFLHDYRSTVIVAVSMPVSIVSSFTFMRLAGFSLNVMSLMGLSTVVGILVANSVIVLENIFRHKSLGRGKVESASRGTSEIAIAVVASTLTNLVVFLPLGTMSSIAGRMFEQFSLTVVFATVFSLLTAFTLTPMMAALILPEHDKKKHPVGERLERLFASWTTAYGRILSSLLLNRKRGAAVIGGSVLLLVASLIVASTIGFEFVPDLDEGFIGVRVELPLGSDLDATGAVLKQLEERVRSHDEVSHFWTELGRIGETEIGANVAYLKIQLVDASGRDLSTAAVAARLTEDFSDVPNATIGVAPLVSFSSGRKDIEFFLHYSDDAELGAIHNLLVREFKQIPGLTNLTTSYKSGKPELSLVPRREVLTKVGLTAYDLALALRSSIEGLVASVYKEGAYEYDIRVLVADESVDSPTEIGSIPVSGPSGTYRMDQLADIRFSEGYGKVLHHNRGKAVNFGCDVGPGYLTGDIMDEIDAVLERMDLPDGFGTVYSGMASEMGKAIADIAKAFIIAILLTYMVLAAILESLTQPLLILGTVPLALIGVFGGLAITGLSMNIISMLAIVMLIGIVVNSAILLLDYTNLLTRQQGMSVHDALITACPTKLKPILMSNVAIILGMTPLALGIGAAGAEMRQPMGVVSIGGLVVSTFLTLIVIPVLYNVVARRGRKAGEVRS